MRKFIQDLFQTKQPDGTYKWDATNPAWSVAPWLGSVVAYVSVGIFTAIRHPETFELMQFAAGAGALLGGGGAGVLLHSRANT